jgi:hypothetical protein
VKSKPLPEWTQQADKKPMISTIIAGMAKLIRKSRWIGLQRGVWSWR